MVFTEVNRSAKEDGAAEERQLGRLQNRERQKRAA
jgi:hypothetical protein